MLIGMTEDEKKIWIKQHQLIYMLKRQYSYKPVQFLEKIDNSIFELADDEIEERFKKYESQIMQETWVDCYPMYFHISEFDKALNAQLAFNYPSGANEYILKIKNEVNEFYRLVNKSQVNELTQEEKEELFWITHPITY